jgi:predicted TIM-barrel fold metal-dependent hydrolase
MREIPRIISVDDHVVEPPNVWQDRLPAKWRDVGPRVVRDTATFSYVGGVFSYTRGDADGAPCDWWLYDDLAYPSPRVSAAAGFSRDDVTMVPITYDEMRPGCWQVEARIDDMTLNHVDASLCFPTFPRFCGQTFAERKNKELADLCVKAFNDWMIDEWCGESRGHLIPLTIIQLWDPHLAAAEIARVAAKGCHAVAFSENPYPLGLPSMHHPGRHWDPFLAACEAHDVVINMHIGSSSKMPSTSPDAPALIGSALTFQNAMGSMLDWILSGVFDRFPRLRIAYSEGQVGWMPYVLERADKVWEDNRGWGGVDLKRPPSSYVQDHIWGCVFDDQHGLENRHKIGMRQICFETDYPHSDSTWPHTLETAQKIAANANLTDDESYLLMRGNAIDLYSIDIDTLPTTTDRDRAFVRDDKRGNR